jgi:NAD(P)H-hydrate epimerase
LEIAKIFKVSVLTGVMETISARDMQILDLNCEFYGLSRLQLMENAGRGIAEEIIKRFNGGKILVFAGTGNNGGDGFVAARHLKGFDIEIFLLGKKRDIRSEIARQNLEILEKCGYKIREVLPEPLDIPDDCTVVVDAMLGTGVRGELREPFKSAIRVINESNAYVVAVDLPTGLDPDTGGYSDVVKADLTVTFHKPKPGILKAEEVVGEVVVKEIGIPDVLEKLCGPGDVKTSYKRWSEAHKGKHGRILVIGGGEYTGAPAFSALASYVAGADIVTVAVPEPIWKVVASYSPNLIVRGVKGNSISEKNLSELLELASRHDVIVAGMGVGKKFREEFRDFISEFLKDVKRAVLDAEGLISDIPEDTSCILTPHRGEFRREFGEVDEQRVKKVAEKTGATVLLKGKEDWITDGVRFKMNRSGNAGMTVGGTGDVLAGICGALFCNDDTFHAACSAAFVNGFAGDLCFEKYGYNYTSVELIREIPAAFKKCMEFE